MSRPQADVTVRKAVTRNGPPWGIRFRFESAGSAPATLGVVRAAVAREVPGWEIREVFAETGWFEAVPPPLPDYVEANSEFRKEFDRRLTTVLKRFNEKDRNNQPEVYGVAAAEFAAGMPKLLLRAFLGETDDDVADDLDACLASDTSLQRWLRRWRPGRARLPLLVRLLEAPERLATPPTDALCQRLTCLRDAANAELREEYETEIADVALLTPGETKHGHSLVTEPPAPLYRQLRAYSFDPILATTLDTAPIYQVTIPTRWEDVRRGPVGEYLEVVDIDPASGCAYVPVDLEHPYIVAQDGLPPSEGNPQFHQQMVYAVAMNTIQRFELALGRPVFWSPLRPWDPLRADEGLLFPPPPERPPSDGDRSGEEATAGEDVARRSRYIQRLRIYPHALREANAYYSPGKRALLFGYFPSEGDTGGMVFTCLSHDVIVHETTHAIVDGMHSYFNEPSNDDVWAFHEAFADIMALFQHFTYPEVLSHQLASTQGNLETDNLLGQLAQQFGQATGRRGGLRNYLGQTNEDGQWVRNTPDPKALSRTRESHERGSILVAAVFDAFIALYNDRVRDLVRIATGGTGVLPVGQINPDLANRLAREAARAAEEVLSICIRAMDYLPPVDVTFGEFLRALITADYELSPTLRRDKRIAFIDAFRSWGIYPRDVATLSEDSLRWRGPEKVGLLQRKLYEARDAAPDFTATLVATLEAWRPGGDRRKVFNNVMAAQAAFYQFLKCILDDEQPDAEDVLPGLDLRPGAIFNVDNMRPARRIGVQGEFRTEMIVEVVQTCDPESARATGAIPFRGGATLIIDLQSWEIRYTIFKRLWETPPKSAGGDGGELSRRRQRSMRPAPRAAWQGELAADPLQRLAATYSREDDTRWSTQVEPFALLHRNV